MDCFVASLLAMTGESPGGYFVLTDRVDALFSAFTGHNVYRRHCERQRSNPSRSSLKHGLLRRFASRNDDEAHSAFAGCGCKEAAFAIRAAFAMPAKAAIFFCGSEPGCTTPADIIRVAASSAVISTSIILLLGT